MMPQIAAMTQNMTDNNSKNVGNLLYYFAPEVKTIEFKARQVFCQSPGVSGWDTTNGSYSEDDMPW